MSHSSLPVSDAAGSMDLPQGAVLPSYGDGGLFGLVRRLGDYLSGGHWSPPAALSISQTEPPTRKLVFILIDGLGDNFLQTFGAGSALLAHRAARLTSVFPSTTASAVTTTLSGLPPLRHAMTGWFVHDRRFGGVIAPLPLWRRDGGPLRNRKSLPRLFPYRTLFQRRKRPAVFVSPMALAYSPYSARHSRGARTLPYRGLAGMVDAVVDAVANGGTGPLLVHAYYPNFDALSHAHGCTSDRVVAEFRRVDAAFQDLVARLRGSGTDVVLTADHGFIDSPPERVIELESFPRLRALLTAPLFGERRAAFCAVRRGAEGAFEQLGREVLAGKAVVARTGELVEQGLFGPGRPDERFLEHVGTHALLMEPGWTLRDHVVGEGQHDMIGVHGGLSPDEMWIPLVTANC